MEQRSRAHVAGLYRAMLMLVSQAGSVFPQVIVPVLSSYRNAGRVGVPGKRILHLAQ